MVETDVRQAGAAIIFSPMLADTTSFTDIEPSEPNHVLLHPPDHRTLTIDLLMAGILSTVAGMVNTAGFYAVGFFSANMTGNVSLISESSVAGLRAVVLIVLAIVITFFFGSFVAAIASTIVRQMPQRTFPQLIIAESVILFAACIGFGLPGYAVAMGLSFAMGIQNATSTLISNAKVRTTHVSGMITDLGIEAAMLIRRADRSENLPALKLHALTVGSFLVGGVTAALMHMWAPAVGIALPALILMAAGLTEIARSNHS